MPENFPAGQFKKKSRQMVWCLYSKLVHWIIGVLLEVNSRKDS
jgi:hypothetical protein